MNQEPTIFSIPHKKKAAQHNEEITLRPILAYGCKKFILFILRITRITNLQMGSDELVMLINKSRVI